MAARQSSMLETRAQRIGVKPKVLAARTRKRLKSIRAQLQALAAPWDEINNSIEFALTHELMPAFDAFEQEVEDSVAWLNEIPED